MDTSQLLRGVLDVAVLAVLEEGDAYGYDIVRRLRESGVEDVGEASVYGTLRRLFDAGFLSAYVQPSDAGPNRKYYRLTEAGRAHLNDSSKTWRRFSEVMALLLKEDR